MHQRNDGNLGEKDHARTPPSLFKKLDDIYHFDLDAAATKENSLCRFCWTQETRGLEQEWHKLPGMNTPYSPSVYVNPPYSRGNIDRFIKKGYEESLQGAVVVMLLPSDTSTKYFHDYCMKASKLIFLQPRVKFLRPSGIPFGTSPRFGSVVVVFDNTLHIEPRVSSMRWC